MRHAFGYQKIFSYFKGHSSDLTKFKLLQQKNEEDN